MASVGFPATWEANLTDGGHICGYTFKSIGILTGIKIVKKSNEVAHDHVQMKLSLQQPQYIVATQGKVFLWSEVLALADLEYNGFRRTPHEHWSAYSLSRTRIG